MFSNTIKDDAGFTFHCNRSVVLHPLNTAVYNWRYYDIAKWTDHTMESDCYHSLSTVFYTELLRRERDPLCTLLPEGWRLWRNWISKIQRERWQTITHAYSLSVSHLTNTHKCCMGLFFFPDSPSSCCTEESTLYGVWFGVTWCKYQCEGRIWENMSSSQCREWIYSSLGGKILMWCWSINIQSLLLHIHSYFKYLFWQVLKGLMRNGVYINLEERDTNGTKRLLPCWFL